MEVHSQSIPTVKWSRLDEISHVTSSAVHHDGRGYSGRIRDSTKIIKGPPTQVQSTLGNDADDASSIATSTSCSKRGVSSTCGFMPLFPTMASPVCTASSVAILPEEQKDAQDMGSLNASCSDPKSITSKERLLLPTWIAIPPTPPRHSIRRSVTCILRKPQTNLVSPSVTFPASLSTHGQSVSNRLLKRSASAPAILAPSPPLSSISGTFAKIPRLRDMNCTGRPIERLLRANLLLSNVAARSRSSSRLRPIFHLATEANSDGEDEAIPMINDCHTPNDSPKMLDKDQVMSSPSSESESSLDEMWSKVKKGDEIRRYHALLELLTTEMCYLKDLRALVTVYLRQIPTLSARPSSNSSPTSVMSFSRSSSAYFITSSFNPSTRANSNANISAMSASTRLPPESQAVMITSKDKNTPRYIFSDIEVEKLTRNAEEILQLHELFAEELRVAVNSHGYSANSDGSEFSGPIANIEVAIGAVATKFTTEASRFSSYQQFCSGHPEALDLIRKAHQQYPAEWDAFEQRCSILVSQLESDLQGPEDQSSSLPPSPDEQFDVCAASLIPGQDKEELRNRTRSLSSLDGAVRTLRSQLPKTVPKAASTSQPDNTVGKKPSRLLFADYLIKPVQRVCKYPLLLDSLKTAKSLPRRQTRHRRSDVNVIAESALQAMRHVARSVDDARHRQDVALQSALIVSRMALAPPMTVPSSLSSAHGTSDLLTPYFLSSLGACLLAGSLDVVHYPASGATIKVKYLGGFLYVGGYFVLVKVCKGKVYEPRHWFSLIGFDLSDADDEDAVLSCSFRLSCKGHIFEIGAGCQREKEAWVNAIQESLECPPTWTNEPISSLQFDTKGEYIAPPVENEPPEVIGVTLPTIQSIPELSDNSDNPDLQERAITASLQIDAKPKTPSRQGFSGGLDSPPVVLPPSRRSSTTSVKAIFSPMASDPNSFVLRRTSTAGRLQVDQALNDVTSQICLAARSHANSHEEELFRPSKSTISSFARSSSALSMASAMVITTNRLSKRESVRVSRRRSLVEAYGMSAEFNSLPPTPKRALSRALSLAGRRQVKKIKIVSSPSSDRANGDELSVEPESLPDSPINASHHSSNTTCDPQIAGPSSDILPPYPGLSQQTNGSLLPEPDCKPKRSRSVVENVRGLFRSGSTSPVGASSSSSAALERTTKNASLGLLQRLTAGNSHRRARSNPIVQRDHLPVLAEKVIWQDSTDTSSSQGPNTTLDHSALLPDGRLAYCRAANGVPDVRHASLPSINTKRKRPSLFSSVRQHSTDKTADSVERSLSLLRRLKSIDVG